MDLLRKDPRTSLSLLTEGTGGILVDSTNDLGRIFRSIEQDRRFRYVLTYVPQRAELTGEWRKLAVKVKRRSAVVRARSGYMAVPQEGTAPLLAYEGPVLAALEGTPPPKEIPVRLGCPTFPEEGRSRVSILVAASESNVTFVEDRRSESARAHFTILSRVRDAAGTVVHKSSQQFELQRSTVREPSTPRDVLYVRDVRLQPGRYQVEVGVHDSLGQRAGVEVRQIAISNDSGPAVSSLVIVNRGEALGDNDRNIDSPLRFNDVMLYPNLGEPIQRSAKVVTIFALITNAHDRDLNAKLELRTGSRLLGSVALRLDSPDENGRIRQLAQIPTERLVAGQYELRLVVGEKMRVVRDTSFTLVD